MNTTKAKTINIKDMFGKANLIFTMIIVCMPLIISFIDIVGIGLVNYEPLLIIFFLCWMLFYAATAKSWIFSIPWKKLIRSPLAIMIFSLYLWTFISVLVTNTFTTYYLVLLCYLPIGLSAFMMEDKHKSLVINTIIGVICTCVIMGFFDPNQDFMPGFYEKSYKWSLQFLNPNHIGYVVALVETLVVGLFVNTKDIRFKIYYAIAFCIMGIYIFLNNSFAPITAIFVGLVIYFIYYWITRKKFPLEIMLSVLILLFFAALCESVPFLERARFISSYGYLTELLCRVDAVLGTDLIGAVGGVKVEGLETFDRFQLWAMSAQILGESFLFGQGCGFSREFGPHNEFFCIALDFGFVAGALFIAIFVMCIIYTFKNKNKSKITVPLMIALCAYYFSGLFGSLTARAFMYMIVILSMLMKENTKRSQQIDSAEDARQDFNNVELTNETEKDA